MSTTPDWHSGWLSNDSPHYTWLADSGRSRSLTMCLERRHMQHISASSSSRSRHLIYNAPVKFWTANVPGTAWFALVMVFGVPRRRHFIWQWLWQCIGQFGTKLWTTRGFKGLCKLLGSAVSVLRWAVSVLWWTVSVLWWTVSVLRLACKCIEMVYMCTGMGCKCIEMGWLSIFIGIRQCMRFTGAMRNTWD